jgi:hypothetical protein
LPRPAGTNANTGDKINIIGVVLDGSALTGTIALLALFRE